MSTEKPNDKNIVIVEDNKKPVDFMPPVAFKIDKSVAIRDVSAEAIAELNLKCDKDLKELDITKSEDLKTIKANRTAVLKTRTGAQKYKDKLKAPALEWCDVVQKEFADDIEPKLKAIEKKYNDAIDVEAKRKKDEKEKADRVERERVAKIEVNIQKLKDFPSKFHGKESAALQKALTQIDVFEPSEKDFGDRLPEAKMLHEVVVDQVKAMLETVVNAENQAAENTRLKKEAKERATADKIREDAAAKETRVNTFMQDLTGYVTDSIACNSEGVMKNMKRLEDIDTEGFGDRTGDVQSSIAGIMSSLQRLYDEKRRLEDEEEKRQAEIAHQKKLDDDERQAELDKLTEQKTTPPATEELPVIDKVDVSPGSTQGHAAPMSKPDEPKNATELQTEQTYEALIELLDENSAFIIMEALTAGSIPHVDAEWAKDE